jgi:hypothetical protein
MPGFGTSSRITNPARLLSYDEYLVGAKLPGQGLEAAENPLREYRDRFPAQAAAQVERLAEISGWLRKEREFSFCGDVDFIPTEEYTRADALRAIEDARFVVSVVESVIPVG